MLLIRYIIVLSLNTGGTKQCFVVLRNSERATLAQNISLPRENIAFNEQSNCGFRKNISGDRMNIQCCGFSVRAVIVCSQGKRFKKGISEGNFSPPLWPKYDHGS